MFYLVFVCSGLKMEPFPPTIRTILIHDRNGNLFEMKCFLFAIVPHRKISLAFHFSWANVSIMAKNLVPIKSVHRNLLGLFQCSLTREWIASVDWKTIISFGWQTRSWWQYNCVLFSGIAFNFHQIYPQSCSQTRIHTHIRTPWKNSGKFKTKTSRIRSESNFPIARFGGTVRKYAKHSNYKSSTCFNFICAIFKHNAENVLFTTCSSTSRAHMNGIKMESERIHSSFFSHRTHITYICMCMCVCYEALFDCRKVVYVENVLSLCCMHERWL